VRFFIAFMAVPSIVFLEEQAEAIYVPQEDPAETIGSF